MAILVTGAAGFIGFSVANRLVGEGREVIGVDCLSPYYSTRLKQDRLAALDQISQTPRHCARPCSDGGLTLLFIWERSPACAGRSTIRRIMAPPIWSVI